MVFRRDMISPETSAAPALSAESQSDRNPPGRQALEEVPGLSPHSGPDEPRRTARARRSHARVPADARLRQRTSTNGVSPASRRPVPDSGTGEMESDYAGAATRERSRSGLAYLPRESNRPRVLAFVRAPLSVSHSGEKNESPAALSQVS